MQAQAQRVHGRDKEIGSDALEQKRHGAVLHRDVPVAVDGECGGTARARAGPTR
jgi:hypothetical protein